MAKFKRKLIFSKSKEALIDHSCAVGAYGVSVIPYKVTLKIWQNKSSMYGKIYYNDECVGAASFYEKDGDMSIHRIKEYFNF